MSHLTERKEKVCLNCNAEVHGRYCHVCGQENIEPKESFWHLVTHFAYDITHFDGKFFSTLKYLLFKPGYLSHEYLRGRRASYLHPIRMYVFTSAIFFLIFFSMGKEENVIRVTDTSRNAADIVKSLEKKKKNYQESLRDSMPALARKPIEKALAVVDSDLVLIRKDTTAKNSLRSIKGNFNFMGGTAGTDYSNVAAYDSAQAAMPEEQRDSYIERRFVRQNIHLKEAYNSDGSAILKAILKKFKNLFPQILFLSLPLLALALQLLYVRRKKFYYVNHVIFTIHLYCGTFIIILAGMALEGIFRIFGYSAPEWVNVVLTIGGFFYWYKSMRNFYEQRRAKTILKYMLLLFLGLLIMTLLFTIFFIFSAMSI